MTAKKRTLALHLFRRVGGSLYSRLQMGALFICEGAAPGSG
jgi:hypothetical protein